MNESRLTQEAMILKRFFPEFRWYRHDGELFTEGPMRTNTRATYGVRVVLPLDYPASVPDLLVTYPAPLMDADGSTLASHGASASMHTWGNRGGYLAICHYSADHWSPETTIYKVLVKARIWLEAYERHLQTGEDLDEFLPHQE